MFKNSTTQNHLFLFIAFWLLWAWMMQPVALAVEGSVELLMIKSKVLADAGIAPSEHELSVYLPPKYATSGLAYPTLYLFHGSPGTNRRFFGFPPEHPKSLRLHVGEIAEALVAQGKMKPMIILGPTMPGWINATGGKPWADYFLQDIMPLVEQKYRAIRHRKYRGIYGISKGGSDVVQLAFMRPDLFSVMGGYAAAYRLNMEQLEQLVRNYDAIKYPIRFYIYHGRNDTNVPFADSERFIAFVKEKGWEHVFETSDGDHFTSVLEAMELGLQYFSKFLGEPQVAVQPVGKLATTWGRLRRAGNISSSTP